MDTATAFDGVVDASGKPKPVLGKLLAYRQTLRKPLGGPATVGEAAVEAGDAESDEGTSDERYERSSYVSVVNAMECCSRVRC